MAALFRLARLENSLETEMGDLSSWLQGKMPDIIAESPDSRAWFESSPSAPFNVSDKYINIAGVIPPIWNLEPPPGIVGDVVMKNGQDAGLAGDTADVQNGNGALSDDGMDVDRGEGGGGGMLEDSVTAMMRAGQGHVLERDVRGLMGTGTEGDSRMDVNRMKDGCRDVGEGKGGAQGSLSLHGHNGGRDEAGEDETTDGETRPKPASTTKPGKARGRNAGTKERLPMKNTSKGHRESRNDAKAGLSKQSAIDVDAFFVSDVYMPHSPDPFSPRM